METCIFGDEEVISPLHAKVYVFSDFVLCIGKMNENPQSNTLWEHKLMWFKSSSQYIALDNVNSTPHTSHFLVDSHLMTRTCVAQGSSSSLACAAHITHHSMRHLHALMLCV